MYNLSRENKDDFSVRIGASYVCCKHLKEEDIHRKINPSYENHKRVIELILKTEFENGKSKVGTDLQNANTSLPK